jgi:hypothetical protein
LRNSANGLINALATENKIPQDEDYFISQTVSGGADDPTYHRRQMSKL